MGCRPSQGHFTEPQELHGLDFVGPELISKLKCRVLSVLPGRLDLSWLDCTSGGQEAARRVSRCVERADSLQSLPYHRVGLLSADEVEVTLQRLAARAQSKTYSTASGRAAKSRPH